MIDEALSAKVRAVMGRVDVKQFEAADMVLVREGAKRVFVAKNRHGKFHAYVSPAEAAQLVLGSDVNLVVMWVAK